MQDRYSFHIYFHVNSIHKLYIHNLCIKYRVKSVPVPPFWSTGPPWNTSSRLHFLLLPWHLSSFFPFFHPPPLLFSSSSFPPLSTLSLRVPTQYFFSVAEESLVYVQFTAIFTVLFPLSLFPLVRISTVFIRGNVRPKDIQNFP